MQSNIDGQHPAPARHLPRVTVRALSLVLGLLAFIPASAKAEPPVLSLPARCEIGATCWLVNFVDHDPGPGATDYRCGHLSYDTHKGTDIAIMNDAVMQQGVAVLAAAPGTVAGTRDGMANSTKTDLEDPTRLRGRDCGNGVRIDHGDGWSTQYCHMKNGSIRVRTGDTVARGQVIGEIGRSGRTEFPHIHLSLRQNERVIDPFTGESSIQACRAGTRAPGLWEPAVADTLNYPGPQPYHLGFATSPPKSDDIETGRLAATAFDAGSPALVFWVQAFSLNKGDRVTLRLIAPDGSTVADHAVAIDRPLARWHGFTGRKKRGNAWEKGRYTGVIRIARGATVIEKSARAVVE